MPRDIGNEVIVAIVAVAILVFALTFGIILSLSNAPVPVVTSTVEESASLVAEAVTMSATPETPVLVSAVATSTVTPAITPTLTPTPTPTVTFRPTRIRPSATPTVTNTNTSLPTVTSLPPTATQTETSTPTLTVTPTATLRPGRTPIPTATLTLTATPTPVPLEATAVQGTPAGYGVCEPPVGWVTYTVQAADTFSSIARSVGSSVMELQVTNCFTSTEDLSAGQTLYVPAFGSANRPGIGVISDEQAQCPEANIVITHPEWGGAEAAGFVVWGTATGPDFAYYKIELRLNADTHYRFVASSDEPFVEGPLALIDPADYPPGDYWLRLSVVNTSGHQIGSPCSILLTLTR